MDKPVKLVGLEDAPFMRNLLRKILAGTEIQIVEFHDTESGLLSSLNQHSPDIVLMDLVLPGVNSLTLIQKIRKHYPHLFVVVVSSLKDEDILSEVFMMGVHDFIAKPFQAAELLLVLRQASSRRSVA